MATLTASFAAALQVHLTGRFRFAARPHESLA